MICESEAATTSILQHRASTGLQLGAHAPCFRVGTVLSLGTGPPTIQNIGRLQVGPEKAGSVTSLPATSSGPLDLGWFLLGTEAPV